MKSWYLVYTKPRQEKVALRNLQNQAYEAYLPLIQVKKIRQGARACVEEALFPRYLFVKLDEEGTQAWGPIRSTVGVSHLVKFGSKFAQIGQELMSWVQDCAKTNTIDEQYKEGDVLTVTQGPFKDIEAIFKSYDGEKRAVLLLRLLAKVIEVKLSLGLIKKVS